MCRDGPIQTTAVSVFYPHTVSVHGVSVRSCGVVEHVAVGTEIIELTADLLPLVYRVCAVAVAAAALPCFSLKKYPRHTLE